MTAIRARDRVDPSFLGSWRGTAWCHVPADEPIDPDRLVTREGDDNRWNGPGEPTLYLAIDVATAVAELARHLESPLDPKSAHRRLIGLHVDVDGVIDLRLPPVHGAMGIDDPASFRDRALTRDVARRARRDESVAGLLVPSIAFLDRPHDAGRGNLVLFVDRLRGGPEALLDSAVEGGSVELRPDQVAPEANSA